jgi:hypothetical protein
MRVAEGAHLFEVVTFTDHLLIVIDYILAIVENVTFSDVISLVNYYQLSLPRFLAAQALPHITLSIMSCHQPAGVAA